MIAIIDYQMGNLRSVQKGFERVGVEAVITDKPAEIQAATHVVLPGVGAFRDAIAQLRHRDLVNPIRDTIDAGTPFLGICLGLQMLFDYSEEDGHYEGLGILPGKVIRFVVPKDHKVPHMGWNELLYVRQPPIFDGLPERSHFYFVHSYYVVPENEEIIAIESEYPDRFCAAVWRDNLFATQFHPEKSQANGLRVLKNFASWSGS
jgi:glutamine amidotransferase